MDLPRDKNGLVKLPKNRELELRMLFQLYCEGTEMTHAERCRQVVEATNKSRSAIYKAAKKHDWENKMIGVLQTREADAIKNRSIKIMETMSITNSDVAFSKIAEDIKGFSYLLIDTSRKAVTTQATIIQYYQGRAEELLQKKIGSGGLSALDEKRLEGYITKMENAEKAVREYLKPSSVARYLQLIGIESAIEPLPDDIDIHAFTPSKLLSAVEEYGMGSVVGNEKFLAEMEESIAGLLSLPEIDATKVVDEQNEINTKPSK